ncbi:MAG TPA: hypothetical protein VI790_00405 [Candidatus Nanoarchaeia archaeon]|nr:hypothetical protein [Candidatus Nanoarchaeia archaeon]
MGVDLPLAVKLSKYLVESNSIDELLVCNMPLFDCSGMSALYAEVSKQKELGLSESDKKKLCMTMSFYGLTYNESYSGN